VISLALLLALSSPTEEAQQLVVVTSSSWTAITARMQRYEKVEARWKPVGPAVDVVVGDGGLGWGIGLHEFASGPGDPRKREGDGRAPAGVFALTRAFGKGGVPQTKLPTHTIDDDDVCVDDVKSPLYNSMVLEPAVADAGPRPFDSFEKLLRADAIYDLFVVVDHNRIERALGSAAPLKGAGSCVFLHQWKRPGAPTIGCTGMSAAVLTDVVMWLDPARHPLLVQLPRDVYARVRDPWQLP
jgi:L,D-peptidoglycan transpeptidase YkuD (ErfK/YbiS/YcfS/YnhG family)